jgi:4-hydroxy-tetrahydrodipicolinate synthase
MVPHLLTGVTAPIVTPLDEFGRPDASAAEVMLGDLAAAGISGLLVLGTNGEGPAFDPDVSASFAAAIASRWRELTAGQGRVFVAVFGSSTRETLDRATRITAVVDVDGLVIPPPHYFRYTIAELEDHYRALTDCGAPLVMYNAPRYTGNPIPAKVLRTVAELAGVIGIKDSGSDDELITVALDIAAQLPTFGVSQGNERRMAWALHEGAVGITPGLANIAPAPCVDLAAAVRAGDSDSAEDRQAELDALGAMHAIRPGVACMKAALSIVRRCPPLPAAPMRAYNDDEMVRLRDFLRSSPAQLIAPVPSD